MANKVIKYFIESKEELQKVTWPTQKETIRYTLIVVGLVAVFAVFFGLVDFGAQTGLDALLNLTDSSSGSNAGIDLRTAPAPADIETEAGPTVDSGNITIEGTDENGDSVSVEGEAAEENPVDDSQN